ncbi:MAG: LysE family transporter [Neisseriaceae bacterium]|nr:LysE family transporter [Neisseriaceae bacterium]
MLSDFIQGVILGIGVAVPIGPLNVLMMSYALKNYGNAWAIGIGAMCADIGFFILSVLGVSQLIHRPAILQILAIFGSGFLLYMAYGIFKNARRDVYIQNAESQGNKMRLFFKGYILNFMNPFVIAFWISVSATTAKMGNNFLWSLSGLFLTLFAWISLFPLAIYKSRTLLKKSTVIALSYLSSFILLFFALMLIYKSFFQAA